MFNALQQEFELPYSVSKEEYEYIKNHKDENPALTGFVGFACSFGGKWFGGYAHLKNYKEKNYASYSRNSLIRKMQGLEKSVFLCKDYRNVLVYPNSVVYCDPPYEGTTKYSNSGNFNHEEFWNYCRELSNDNFVFISEYSAPQDFVEIWKKNQTVKLDARKKENVFVNVDRLFVHNSIVEKITI
jgi:DNA adenine methylase